MWGIRDENSEQTSSNSPPQSDGLNNLGTQHGMPSFSPYLNFDPAYFPPSQPEFIFPEGASKQRVRFELAFTQIGSACMAGAGIGGATGFFRGLRATTLAGQTGKLRRTQMLNHVMKNGASVANTLGIVSVMYSGFGVLLAWARGTDDSLNTIAAATATGMLFKSTAGLPKCAMGGAVGLAIASAYCLFTSRQAFADWRIHSINPASK